MRPVPSALAVLLSSLAVSVAIVALAPRAAADDDDKKHEKHHDKDKDKDKKHDDSTSTGAPASSAPGTATASASPDEIVYFLSMHGAAGSDSVIGITGNGTVKGSVVTNLPATEKLHLLRGLCPLSDGSILVSNAWMQDTRILRFGPIVADGTAPFNSIFVQGGGMNAALLHTYAIAVAPDGSIYCSNQDTITVTRYAGINSPTPGAPLPLPSSLASRSDIQPGVFVPSAKDDKHGVRDVRGIAFGPDGQLYVADRKRGEVLVYNTTTGERTRTLVGPDDGLKQPIQLAFTADGSTLFISDDGKNCVWRVSMADRSVSQFVPPGASGLSAPSALLIDGDRLLVGSREGKQILAFSLKDGTPAAQPFVAKLPDNPEFLVRVRK
ncbi:MAG: hypothetical protein JNM94_04085 [Phycisphaerae bacterium]|nr:hypothetical protein [Phycisphaerae bacterium]